MMSNTAAPAAHKSVYRNRDVRSRHTVAGFLLFVVTAVAARSSGAAVAAHTSSTALRPLRSGEAYWNTNLPIQDRVKDLVARMSFSEKIAQMGNEAPAIDRLGVPSYNWWNEALHGIAGPGYATVFPQAIGLAAAWNTDLHLQVATAISDEGRARYSEFQRQGNHNQFTGITFFSPNINIFRDPRWGRGHETYGEDPYLTGKLGVAFVKGLQGDDPRYLKSVATPKHFAVHSGPESDRHSFDSQVSLHDLFDTYLPAFERTVTEGKAASVMASYNAVNGVPAAANSFLLNDILRKTWGFDGYVVTDCGAVGDIFYRHHYTMTLWGAAASAVRAGSDLDCGGEYSSLSTAKRLGMIREDEVTRSVERLFTSRFRLGMFDPQDQVPYASIPFLTVDSEEHRQLSRRAAQESMVLLKNSENILPLRKDVGKVAVIGPNADDLGVLLGNYSANPSRYVTPLAGIREKLFAANVVYAQGSERVLGGFRPIPYYQLTTENHSGLKGEYFANKDLSGSPLFTRLDPEINFNWASGAPDQRLPNDGFSVRWTGQITAPATGDFTIGASTDDGVRVYLDGKKVIDVWKIRGQERSMATVKLEVGKTYDLRMEYFEDSGQAGAKLEWSSVAGDEALRQRAVNEAVQATQGANVAVLVLGLSTEQENEETDRSRIELPDAQLTLYRAIKATGIPTVVVLVNGGALAIPEIAGTADAILESWYPGEEGGSAVADVLFGDYNPAGRLPVTMYRATEELPPFNDYNMQNRTYRYYTGQPTYEFGFGLSYTQFRYSNFSISDAQIRPGQQVDLKVSVQNSGGLAGDEVVQLYVGAEKATQGLPVRKLIGFSRQHFAAGESRDVMLSVPSTAFSTIGEDGKPSLLPGNYVLTVGGSQPSQLTRTQQTTLSQIVTIQ